MHNLFVPDDEKRLVEEVFNNAVDCLSEEDRKLPQVKETGMYHMLYHFFKSFSLSLFFNHLVCELNLL